MEYFDRFCKYLSGLTTINETYISLILSTEEFAVIPIRLIFPSEFLITSRVCVPIEPVAPKIEIFFINTSYNVPSYIISFAIKQYIGPINNPIIPNTSAPIYIESITTSG